MAPHRGVALALLALCGAAALASAAPPGFVTAAGAGFVLDGAPLHVVGANAYNLMTATSFGGGQAATATAVLDTAASLGLNVVRTWAFCDGNRPGALQPRAGVFDESVFRALDAVIAQAQERNVRLLLTLTNNWGDYGGIQEYVWWAQAAGEGIWNNEDFFSSPTCQQLYRGFFAALLSRVNTVTGVAYRDDPTIFAWELINEPRVSQQNIDVLQSWIEEMSAGIKALDPHHMVTTGCEGFFGPSSPDRQRDNPYSGSEGTDFYRNHAVRSIDFAVAHVWADQWLKCDQPCQLSFVNQWHTSHLQESQRLGKPFVLEEFGAPRWWRDDLFSSVYDLGWSAATASGGGAVGGQIFWLLAGSSSQPDYDTYTVYPGDASTLALVRQQVGRMRQLDAPAVPPTPDAPPPDAPPTPDAPPSPNAPPPFAPPLPPLSPSPPFPRAPPFPGVPPIPPTPEAPAAPPTPPVLDIDIPALVYLQQFKE